MIYDAIIHRSTKVPVPPDIVVSDFKETTGRTPLLYTYHATADELDVLRQALFVHYPIYIKYIP